MHGIADDMAEVCPDAWLLNYTNPMAMLCWATYSGSPQQKVVGLCHSVQNTTRELAEIVGVPFDEVTFLGAGRQPPGLHPALRARRREPVPGARRGDRARPRAAAPGAGRRSTGAFGYFPTESSEHSAEYLPWFMRHDDEIERLRIAESTSTCDESEENLAEYELNRERAGRRRAAADRAPRSSTRRRSSTRS